MPSRQILPVRHLLQFQPRPHCPRLCLAQYPLPSSPSCRPLYPPFSLASRNFSRSVRLEGTHYEVLGVLRNATPDEVKKAFYALSKTSHPDHNRDDPTAAKRFSRISEAYSILGTPAKRAKYDTTLGHDDHLYHHHHHHDSTGPAGGRPASGLSRRRTRFYGPPPSYKHSPHTGNSAAHAHEQHYGGVGYGSGAYTRPIHPSGMPYFDKESHHRTHVKQDERRTSRNEERAAQHRSIAKGQPSMAVNFVIFSSVLVFAMAVPTMVEIFTNPTPKRATRQ